MTVETERGWSEVLADARVELHDRNSLTAAAASLLAGTVLVALLWRQLAHGPLVAWWAGLAAALGLRLAVRSARRARQLELDISGWLWRHRAAYAVHGLMWGALAAWAVPQADAGAAQVLAFVGAAMVGGSLITGAFDLAASAAYVVPAALPLVAGLAGLGGAGAPDLALLMVVFLVLLSQASRRAAQQFVAQVRASHAERLKADEARRSAADVERARRELADQHRLLRQLVDGTPQGYWFVDPNGRTIDVNPAMCALLGRSRDEVLGGGVFDFFTGPERAVLEHELARRRTGSVGGYEVDIVRPDGSRVHALNNATPILDAAGRRIGSIGLWTDLSLQKRAENALRTYERLTNSLTDLVAVVGTDRCWRLLNDAWCAASGVAREAALGRPAAGHPLLGEAAAAMADVERCFAGELPALRVQPAVLAGGRAVRLQLAVMPVQHAAGAAVDGVIVIARDVTEQEADRAATRASAELLRHTLEATGDAIFASDALNPDEPVRLVNAQMLHLWGLPPDCGDTLTPRRIMAAAAPLFVDPEAEARHVADVIARNAVDESIVRLRDGRVLHRRCVPSPHGHAALRVWTFRDITAQERVHEQLAHHEAEQRAMLEAFPGYIAVMDAELRYRFVNPRVAHLLGRRAEEIVGRSARDLLDPPVYAANQRDVERAATGEIVRTERHYAATAGRDEMDLEITYLAGPPGPDGSRLFYAFGVDVTERKRVQRSLAAARDEAERANRAKSRFLSHMSHELRTPLNAIAGFAQLLARDPRSPLLALQQEWVGQIQRGSQHLTHLVGEVLDLADIESGPVAVQLEAVRLDEPVHDGQAVVAALAQEHGVRLLPPELDPDLPAALADRARVRQVLVKLLSNAVKYNRPGGEVRVRVRRQASELVVEVHDTGAGISEELRGRLFQPFDRLGAERGVIEGSGVGLLLARHLVEAMGGRIGFDSRPGVGSVFWVRLPAAAADAVSAVAPAAAAGLGARTATVLCIDDNPVNLMLVEAMLEEMPGLRVASSTCPEQGLQQAGQLRPDLVLLDIHMPGLDGYQVLARLKADAAFARTPVVAVSADAHGDDIAAALRAGFAAYLTKPVDMDELRVTVTRLLGTGAARQATA